MVAAPVPVEVNDYSILPGSAVDREWPLLLVLAAIQFTHIIDFMVIMPLGPQFIRLFLINPQQFSLLVSAYTFSASMFGFVAGLYADRFDRKRLLLSLYGCFIIATLLCALAPTYELLLTARAVAGAFGGTIAAVIFAIIADAIPEHRRGAATGTIMSAFSVAAVAGVPTGLFLANHFTWRAPFLMLTFLGSLVWLVAWQRLPSVRAHLKTPRAGNEWRQIQTIFGNRRHLTAFSLIATLMFAGFSVIPFISPYMVANVGLKEGDLPYLYFSGGLATLFTARFIGRLADHHGKQKVFTFVAALSILPILLITQLPRASLTVAILAMVLFMVLVSGRLVPAIALISMSVEPHLRGSFMSFTSSIQQMAAGAAAFGAGAIIGKSTTGTLTHYGKVGMLAATATMVSIFLARKLRTD